MATNKPATAVPVNAEPAAEVTLEEFCIRLSVTDRRVELLAGFNAYETASGSVKDTEANFRARFDEFVNKPV